MKKTQKMPFLIGAFLLAICASASTISEKNVDDKNVSFDSQIEKNNQNNYESVYSYTDVFKEYYNRIDKCLKDCGYNIKYSFDEFCNNYYLSNQDFETYLMNVVEDSVYEGNGTLPHVAGAPRVVDLEGPGLIGGLIGGGGGIFGRTINVETPDYILKGTYNETSSGVSYQFDGDITPSAAFTRTLYYSLNSYSVQPGDILVETKPVEDTERVLLSLDPTPVYHCAFVYDNRKYTEENVILDVYGNYHAGGDDPIYIQTIEAGDYGVMYGFLDDIRMINNGVVILRPKNVTQEEVNLTKEYAKDNLFKVKTVHDIVRTFTSAGFVKSAYRSAGVTICGNDYNLLNSDYLEPSSSKHLYTKLLNYTVDGSNKTATIEVYNPNDYQIEIIHSTYFCSEVDASVGHSKSGYCWRYIEPKSSIIVTVNSSAYSINYTDNDSATFKYYTDGVEYVTYCTDFNTAGLSMICKVNAYKSSYPLVKLIGINEASRTFRIYNLNRQSPLASYREKDMEIYYSKNSLSLVTNDANANSLTRVTVEADKAYKDVTVSGTSKYAVFYANGSLLRCSDFISYSDQLYMLAYCSGMKLKIKKNISISGPTEMESRYFEEMISLIPSQVAEYTFTFACGGYKEFETFGSLETQMELLDSNGRIIVSDYSNNGFKDNAKVIAYVRANEPVTARVWFESKGQAGKTKLAVTATSDYDTYKNWDWDYIMPITVSETETTAKLVSTQYNGCRLYRLRFATTGYYDLWTSYINRNEPVQTFFCVVDTNEARKQCDYWVNTHYTEHHDYFYSDKDYFLVLSTQNIETQAGSFYFKACKSNYTF